MLLKFVLDFIEKNLLNNFFCLNIRVSCIISIMIFITGYRSSGKSQVAEILKSRFKFTHIETSDYIMELKAQVAPEKKVWEWLAEMESQYGEDYFDNIIIQGIRETQQQLRNEGKPLEELLVTGIRRPQSITNILNTFQPQEGFRVLGVCVEPSVMYDRFIARNRDEGDAARTPEQFLRIIDWERRRGVGDLMMQIQEEHSKAESLDTPYQIRNFILIDNNNQDSLKILEGRVTHLFREKLGYREIKPTTEGDNIGEKLI